MRVHPNYYRYVKWLIPSAGAMGAIGAGRAIYRRGHPLPTTPSPRNCPGGTPPRTQKIIKKK